MNLRKLLDSELTRPTVAVMVTRLVGNFAGFTMVLVLARGLGADQAGIYFLSASVASIMAMIGRLGLDAAMVRFVSTASAEGDWAEVASVYRKGVSVAGGFSIVLAVAVVVSSSFLADHVFSEPMAEKVFRTAAFLIPVWVLMQIHIQILKALRRPIVATALQAVGPPGVASAIIFSAGIDSASEAIAVVLGTTSGFLMVAAVLWHGTARKPSLDSSDPRLTTGTLLRTSFPLVVASSLGLVIAWSDTIMLGIVRSAQDVGIYTPALRVAQMIAIVLLALGSVAPPRFAILYARRQHSSLEYLVRDTARLGTLIALPASLFAIVAADWIMSIFGSDFGQGANALRILAVGQFVNASMGSLRELLMMTGHQRYLQRTMMMAAVSNITLNAILIPLWGIIGAACATSASVIGINLVNALWVRRRLGIEPIPFLPTRQNLEDSPLTQENPSRAPESP